MRFIKVSLIILSSLLLLYWVSLWLAGLWLRQKLHDTYALSEMAKTYSFQVKRISLHPLKRTINLHKVTLDPRNADSLEATKKSYVELSIDKISLEGIALKAAIEQQKIQLQRLHLLHPIVVWTAAKTLRERPKDKKNIPDVPAELEGLQLAHFDITDGHFSSRRPNETQSLIELPRIDLRLSDISLRADSLSHDQSVMISLAPEMTLKSFSFRIPDSFYRLGVTAITLDRDKGELLLEDVSLKPIRGLYKQATGLALQDDVFEISLERLQTIGLNSQAVFNGERPHLKALLFENPVIAVVRDKRLPDDLEKRPPMPQNLFKKIAKTLSIDSIKIINGKLSYSELLGREANEAKISFDSLYVLFTGISEDWHNENRAEVVAQAKAKLMGKALAIAKFEWHETLRDSFSFEGKLGAMKFDEVNDMTKIAAAALFRGGFIDSLVYQGAGNRYGATGLFEMCYKNLDMELTKKRTDEPNKLLSKLLNMVIRSNNPTENESVRRVQMTTERVPYKGFFNLYWKTLEDGLIKTVKPGKRKNTNPDRPIKEEWENLKNTLRDG
ncbi:MAG: hypothetical protein RBR87_16510 [Bacteroidales bacterium]|jgi:hypothetical protein|nr:hypothetical protein [Bacteroidales bacterium]